MTPLSRKKGVPTKIIIPKCTDQVFLRYWFGKTKKYQPNTTKKTKSVSNSNFDALPFLKRLAVVFLGRLSLFHQYFIRQEELEER
jgi:hypothetical protein